MLRKLDTEHHIMWLVRLNLFALGQDRAWELEARVTLEVQVLQPWPGNRLIPESVPVRAALTSNVSCVTRVSHTSGSYHSNQTGQQGPFAYFFASGAPLTFSLVLSKHPLWVDSFGQVGRLDSKAKGPEKTQNSDKTMIHCPQKLKI